VRALATYDVRYSLMIGRLVEAFNSYCNTHPLICCCDSTSSYQSVTCSSLTAKRRLLRVDLINWVSMSVRPSVCPSTKSFFDFDKIWYAGRGQRLMHDGMQYDPIQRQGQGHEPLKVENSAIFSKRLSPIMGLANDDHGFLN